MPESFPQKEHERLERMMLWETKARAQGYCCIAGVDEAGRGPLAGPVVAAACVLPECARIPGINDSKKLSPSERFRVFQEILNLPEVDYGIGIIDVLIIDQINILQATFQAMLAAISRLSREPDFLLVDGTQMPSSRIPGEAVVKGDALSQSIASASVIAKETRDQLMNLFDEEWPQ